jgi:hypothetical protein
MEWLMVNELYTNKEIQPNAIATQVCVKLLKAFKTSTLDMFFFEKLLTLPAKSPSINGVSTPAAVPRRTSLLA